jgi:acyl-CoA reductase-like NAD-dependent aldehyde dehydrogenase
VNFVAGEWADAADGATYERRNPANTSDLVGRFAESGEVDADRAANAAMSAFTHGATSSAVERAGILLRAAGILRDRADPIAASLTREEGKPLSRANGEVVRAALALEFFAGEALRVRGATLPSTRPGVSLQTEVEPLGPVLLITPFNFPLFVTALKLGPALAGGNTVVWKPSPYTPRTAIALMTALIDAGLPAGVVNLVLGGSQSLGRSLVDHPLIKAISFTGSTRVGLDVGRRAAARHVRVQLEMGGKNVLAVAPDCDPRLAAKTAAESAFGESGQKCTAAGLVIVPAGMADEFLVEVKSVLDGMMMGDGADPATFLGPLVSAEAVDKANELVSSSVDSGAQVELAGCGRTPIDARSGHFFEPQVLRLPDGPSPLRDQESFAPIMSVVCADNVLFDAVRLMTASGMGLSASILTRDLDLAREFVRRAPAGLVNVNLPTTGVEYQAEFGGWNNSGGAFPEAGQTATRFYTRTKTVAIGPFSQGGTA